MSTVSVEQIEAPRERSVTTSPKTTGSRPSAERAQQRLERDLDRTAVLGDQEARGREREGREPGGDQLLDHQAVEPVRLVLRDRDAGELRRVAHAVAQAVARGGGVAERAAAVTRAGARAARRPRAARELARQTRDHLAARGRRRAPCR